MLRPEPRTYKLWAQSSQGRRYNAFAFCLISFDYTEVYSCATSVTSLIHNNYYLLYTDVIGKPNYVKTTAPCDISLKCAA